MRARFPVAETLALDVKLHTVAVAPGLAGKGVDLRRRLDFSQAAQFLSKDRALGGKLRFICGVLVMTTAAASKIRALGRYAVGRRVEHFQGSRADQTRLLLGRFGPNALARQDVWRQNDSALPASRGKASQAIATIHQLLDRQFEIAYDRDLLPFPGTQTRRKACRST